jgi:hypothetical protein
MIATGWPCFFGQPFAGAPQQKKQPAGGPTAGENKGGGQLTQTSIGKLKLFFREDCRNVYIVFSEDCDGHEHGGCQDYQHDRHFPINPF